MPAACLFNCAFSLTLSRDGITNLYLSASLLVSLFVESVRDQKEISSI